MLAKLQQRLAREESGFTLIELLVVIIIIGILLAIAIPSYLKFKDRANVAASQANVRAAIPAIEAYYADNGTYYGMTLAYLRSTYDREVPHGSALQIADASAQTYCVQSAVGPTAVHKAGPASDIVDGRCP